MFDYCVCVLASEMDHEFVKGHLGRVRGTDEDLGSGVWFAIAQPDFGMSARGLDRLCGFAWWNADCVDQAVDGGTWG